MIHEFKEIIQQAIINQQKGLKNVMASVVHLTGSSYRKPGVRMLISEDFNSIGAVSGGCVEKEIIQRAKSVFVDNKPKIITYDGRYRLGCEGVLYILIEPFFITDSFISEFFKANSNREHLKIDSYFTKKDEAFGNFGSVVSFQNSLKFTFSASLQIQDLEAEQVFTQILQPAFKLILIGGEHDAVKLCAIAANLGWEINVITSLKDSKNSMDFPGAKSVIGVDATTITFNEISENCAIVLMNHSYVQDLKYLVKLTEYQPKYVGVLGAPNKRDRLLNDLFEFAPNITASFLDCMYAPAGLHIGAQTPEEIAVSIIAEILAVTREKEPFSLRKISGKIQS